MILNSGNLELSQAFPEIHDNILNITLIARAAKPLPNN